MCRRFGISCIFHLHRWCEQKCSCSHHLWTRKRQCSETSAHKFQTPGSHPKERIQYSEHGESLKSRFKRYVSSIRCKAHIISTWIRMGCKASRFLTSCSCICSTLDLSTFCFGDMAPVQSNAVGSPRSPPPRRLPIIAGRTRYGKTRVRFISFVLIYCFCRKIWNVPAGPK
jgi:hypothetical protein